MSGTGTRRIVAPDGTAWAVYEIADSKLSDTRALIFVSELGFRRVREFPADWLSLDDETLWQLSWRR